MNPKCHTRTDLYRTKKDATDAWNQMRITNGQLPCSKCKGGDCWESEEDD